MTGQIISHYEILEKLGEGGMGVVYKALDTRLDRVVALKFLPPNFTVSQEDVRRFEQEARAISALNHPSIATIYDVDEVNGQKFLVLEFILGGTLKSKLKQLRSEDREFSIGEVVGYGIQMAEALAHAHRHQIVHRDVKTDNMMLTEDGKIKLTDFGLAKLRGTAQLTKTGSTVGTVAYMSPEQIRGEDVDQRSDLFSFGVVLYELLTSRLPFRGEFETALSYSILNEIPTPVPSLRKNMPDSLVRIVGRCLQKDKTKRYQDADEVLSDLRKVQQEMSGKVSTTRKRSKMPWLVAGSIVLLAAALWIFYPRTATAPIERKSIAVLPFRNMSDSREDEYFSDGITEDIITALSKVSELKVISHTSVMQYKDVKRSLPDIGKALNVATVLEGSIRREGDQVRIVAQLIDAQTDEHLWAETYDKHLTQVFTIQSDVAQQIAAALKAKLSPAEKVRIERKQTENTEAYQLYLKGRFYWNKRRADDLNIAIGYFNEAIAMDPRYALAYAGLASSFVLLPQYGLPDQQALFTQTRSSAMKALEIDSMLAEPHAVLGLIEESHGDHWADAEQHYRRAIDLDPNYPTAHHWYSGTLEYTGRFDEALAEAKRAQELDPLSMIINTNLGGVYYAMRQYDKAVTQYKNTIAIDPDFPWAHLEMSLVYLVQGKADTAIKECEMAQHLAGNTPVVLGYIGQAYAMAGRKKEALTTLDELLNLAKRGNAVSRGVADVYHGLGEKDKAIEWFVKGFEYHEYDIAALGTDPLYDDLRSDPKCIALLRKMGLRK